MPLLQPDFETVADERLRSAIILGISSIPLTIGVNWAFTPNPASATFLFLASIFAGYLYAPRSVDSTRAGALTGIIGGIPIIVWASLMALLDFGSYPPLTDSVGNPVAIAAISIGAACITAVILVVVLLLIGVTGGAIGYMINERLPHSQNLSKY